MCLCMYVCVCVCVCVHACTRLCVCVFHNLCSTSVTVRSQCCGGQFVELTCLMRGSSQPQQPNHQRLETDELCQPSSSSEMTDHQNTANLQQCR